MLTSVAYTLMHHLYLNHSQIWHTTMDHMICSSIPDGSIKFISVINSSSFVTLDTNCMIRMWNADGEQKRAAKLHPSATCVQCVLPLNHRRLLVAADGPSGAGLLFVYNLNDTLDEDSVSCDQILTTCHPKSIRHLIHVSDGTVASASIDGTIALWTDNPKSRVRNRLKSTMNSHAVYANPETRQLLYTVQGMVALPDQQHIVAAIDCSIVIFNIALAPSASSRSSGNKSTLKNASGSAKRAVVLECKYAHSCAISTISLLRGNCQVLITAGIDGEVRTWQLPYEVDKGRRYLRPAGELHVSDWLIASMPIHTSRVRVIECASHHTFATTSDDCNVVIWRDHRQGQRLRTGAAIRSLEHSDEASLIFAQMEHDEAGSDVESECMDYSHSASVTSPHRTVRRLGDQAALIGPDAQAPPLLAAIKAAADEPLRSGIASERDNQHASSSIETKRLGVPILHKLSSANKRNPSGVDILPTISGSPAIEPDVPDSLWKEAERLRIEDAMDIDQVAFSLRAQGYPDEFIHRIRERQRAKVGQPPPS
jgi:WD40 repeat protein